jgi:hypothetical protein
MYPDRWDVYVRNEMEESGWIVRERRTREGEETGGSGIK